MRRRNILAATAAATTAGLLAGSAPVRADGGRRVRTGFANLARDGFRELRGQRVGIISNPTGIATDLTHEVDVMYEEGTVDLRAVFGPEHGFRGTSQAGEGEDFYEDPKTGLPVYNAYNDPEKMKDYFIERELETVVFDIQDVGSRFYTYIWTMFLAMDAAAKAGARFVVLDRPNPTTAENAYGPILHEEYATFVGLKPIAQRHGMTVGELADLFNAEFLDGAVDVTVVEMSGWKRRMSYGDTGLPWVAPSPNMPSIGTARLYPGTCLFEASALSEGRGTTLPFQLLGAPDMDHKWQEALNRQDIPGVAFREAYFVPTFSKWKGETCGGVEVQVTDWDRYDPIRTALAMIITQREVVPQYGWRPESDPEAHPWIDKLTGSDQVRKAIEAGADVDEVMDGWKSELADFRELRREHLRYR